jgi:hypothetical protein
MQTVITIGRVMMGDVGDDDDTSQDDAGDDTSYDDTGDDASQDDDASDAGDDTSYDDASGDDDTGDAGDDTSSGDAGDDTSGDAGDATGPAGIMTLGQIVLGATAAAALAFVVTRAVRERKGIPRWRR